MQNLEENAFEALENLEEFKKGQVYFFIKRSIDIFGSVLGIILLSPLLIIICIMIKLESKGPIFFNQERVGQDGKLFKMYKFRSMVSNAEDLLEDIMHKNEMTAPMFKMKDDPRITKVGKFIRKTSIDELPQLVNIIKGEMSIVGPRPNLPQEVAQFNECYKLKLIARPGLTCFWQVAGRNAIDFDDWMKLDMKYVKERNTWVDIKLIFKTVKVLFGDENAK